MRAPLRSRSSLGTRRSARWFGRRPAAMVAAAVAGCLGWLGAAAFADVDRDAGAGEDPREREAGEEGDEAPRPELERQGGERMQSDLLEEGQRNLEEIRKLLDEIQGDLSGRNTGEPTQAKQREAVSKMTRLIEELGKAAQQQQQQSGGGKKPQPGGKDPKSGKGQEDQRKQPGAARENQKDLQSDRQRQRQQQGQEDNRDALRNNQKADGELPESGGDRILDSLRGSDRWGMLPQKIREEMLSATSKEAPREYRDIIERYYKRISDYYSKKNARNAKDSE